MIFTETKLRGIYVLEIEASGDERGFFGRAFSREEFAAHGLNLRIEQSSISYNPKRRTLRGMHYQAAPHEEAKLVRCTSGAIYDVALDLRPHSPTFKQWAAEELTAKNRKMFYIPEGCAHGFQTLADDSEVWYQISVPYHPESVRGVRWDDPAFGIRWPLVGGLIIAERDRSYPNFE